MRYRRVVTIDFASWWMRPAFHLCRYWAMLTDPKGWKKQPWPRWVKLKSTHGPIEIVGE